MQFPACANHELVTDTLRTPSSWRLEFGASLELEAWSLVLVRSGWRLVDDQPVMANLGDHLREFVGIGWFDDVAVDAEPIAFDEFDGEL